MTADAKRIDPPTVIAIAVIVGTLGNHLHEAGGHGGASLALGRDGRMDPGSGRAGARRSADPGASPHF